MARLETRVARIAEELLAERRSVRPIDVLVGIGWLAQPNVDRWAQGRVLSLDRCVQVDANHVTAAFAALQHWAEERGLTPSKADYQDLQFTANGDYDAERAYRTHWASADIPEPIVECPRRPRRIIVISFAQRVDVCIVQRHRRLPSQGQGRCTVSGLRRPRPPRVSAVRLCRAHPTRHEGQPTVRRRGALEHTTQSL
jgi:hypothetical protein